MKSGILTFCLLCFHFETLYGAGQCLSCPLCKDLGQPSFLDPQVKVEFHKGIFQFNISSPKNVTDFSITLLKGRERQSICALHVTEGKAVPENGSSYCQPHYFGNNTSFILQNLQRNHSDIYIYCLQILLPPPYIDCKVDETYLFIHDKEECTLPRFLSWIIIGLTAFFMTSCICCIIACCLRNKTKQCESNSHEYNSEYMPMAAVTAARKPRF
ncbi:inducible T-cell costimulator [Alligator mississippiensis]|uniref:Inducible T-cell costimulator n=1 Tax=Alligator sinensis TaxID=38654 RepID=A0A3Q0G234_ALLSI|nr:inducible T-cell costimulator [Alligator mississippiensis]XP_025052445.1 inducible T-cell costimulator [Alligator sinensis]